MMIDLFRPTGRDGPKGLLKRGVSNRHLSEIVSSCGHCSSLYANRDFCPPLSQWKQQFCLMNTDFRSGRGTHFVLLYQEKRKSKGFVIVKCYDPLGVYSEPFTACLPEFLRHLRAQRATLKYFRGCHSHQPMSSEACGYYCLAFMHLKMHRKWSHHRVNRLYESSTFHPDFTATAVVLDFIEHPRSCKKSKHRTLGRK